MRDLTEALIELIRFTSTNLPNDVEKMLREAREKEDKRLGGARRD